MLKKYVQNQTPLLTSSSLFLHMMFWTLLGDVKSKKKHCKFSSNTDKTLAYLLLIIFGHFGTCFTGHFGHNVCFAAPFGHLIRSKLAMIPFQDEGDEREKPSISLFADEPEEAPKKRAKAVPKPRQRHLGIRPHISLFGHEPEEHPTSRTASSSSTYGRRPVSALPAPVLFGDEGEERQAHDEEAGESSNDEGSVPKSQTLNINWSGLKLFAQANFVKHAQETGRTQGKKRPYDNTKRALNAAPKSGTSNKEHALDPSRLQALRKKGTCKCFLSSVSFKFRLNCLLFPSFFGLSFARLCCKFGCKQGAFKTCFQVCDGKECNEFVSSFWNLSKCEQDSFVPWQYLIY